MSVMERGWQWHIAAVRKSVFHIVSKDQNTLLVRLMSLYGNIDLFKNPWLLYHKIYSAVDDMVCDDNIVLFHNDLTSSGEQPEQCILAHKSTTNRRLYSNISQILLLYKTWGYHNKFDYKILRGILLICHNIAMRVYEARIKTYYVLCSKIYYL